MTGVPWPVRRGGEDERFRVLIGAHELRLLGELDLATASSFEYEITKLLPQLDTVVVVDISDLLFLDASGLRALLLVEQQLRDLDRLLVLRHPRSVVRRILEVTGLTWLLERATEPPVQVHAPGAWHAGGSCAD